MDQVTVRRFSSKSRKKSGTKGASKLSREVQGKVVDAKPEHSMYKVEYILKGETVQEWFSVKDVTSTTRQKELERKGICNNCPSLMIV